MSPVLNSWRLTALVKVFDHRSGQDFLFQMTTIEGTPSKARTARKSAKIASPPIILTVRETNGRFFGKVNLTPERSAQVRETAEAEGMTIEAYLTYAVEAGARLLIEQDATAAKNATPEKTTVELDAVLVAKIRASLKAIHREETFEDFVEYTLKDMLEPISGMFEGLIEDEHEHEREEIEAELAEIRNA